jgi:DNA-directed RNA polymerase specialized sigma24 family protein
MSAARLRLRIPRYDHRDLPPDVSWDDLLQEAFARVLSGARPPPADVATVAFLAGVMRSLKSEHWRRLLQGATPHAQPAGRELIDAAADPERAVTAYQELCALEKLFAADALALAIIAGLAEGRSAHEIRKAMGVSKLDYESSRKRIRRTLLREGLTFCHP